MAKNTYGVYVYDVSTDSWSLHARDKSPEVAAAQVLALTRNGAHAVRSPVNPGSMTTEIAKAMADVERTHKRQTIYVTDRGDYRHRPMGEHVSPLWYRVDDVPYGWLPIDYDPNAAKTDASSKNKVRGGTKVSKVADPSIARRAWSMPIQDLFHAMMHASTAAGRAFDAHHASVIRGARDAKLARRYERLNALARGLTNVFEIRGGDRWLQQKAEVDAWNAESRMRKWRRTGTMSGAPQRRLDWKGPSA